MAPASFLVGLGQSPPPINPPSPALDGGDLVSLSKRYEQFLVLDDQRNKFMTEMMARYEFMHQQYHNVVAERDRDREWVISWQAEKKQYQQWIKNTQRPKNENPFVLVLIDGDGMIFPDKLLRAGEQGGRRAAAMLSAAVQEYVETEGTATLGTRIVCRLYANVRGLGEVLVRTGAIDEVAVFEDFVRGFTRGKVLFDFVDVGAGKDRADEKIIESLKLFSQDSHCYRLFFGCSHDNGYARVLEEYLDNEEFQDKVILVEGVPFEKELACLLYKTVKFPGLFRDSKIVVRGQNTILASPPITPSDCGSPEMKTYNIYAGLPSRFPPPVRSPSANLMDSPIPTRLSMNLPRTPSSSTLASDGLPSKAAPPGMGSWAAKAAAPAPPASEKLVYKPANRETVIARNRAGQRVDPPNKDYDKAEVDRVKKLKMCNVHFLRQECPYDDGCTHVHDCHPTKEEVATLRLVARMAPCLNGSGCSDIKCIYGHRCPAPSHRSNSAAKGTKSCIFGEACKFPPELHDIDTNVVKTLVIR